PKRARTTGIRARPPPGPGASRRPASSVQEILHRDPTTVGAGPALLEQRLHALHVVVEPRLGIPAEDVCDRVPDHATGRAIAHADRDLRTVARRLEADHARVLDLLAGRGAPPDLLEVRDPRDRRLELDRPAGRPVDLPARAVGILVVDDDVLHVLHEPRKV